VNPVREEASGRLAEASEGKAQALQEEECIAFWGAFTMGQEEVSGNEIIMAN